MIDEVTAVESRPDPKCIIIGVAGGTGSGKSTFTNRIKKEFNEHPEMPEIEIRGAVYDIRSGVVEWLP